MACTRDSAAEEGLLPKESWDSQNTLEPIIIKPSKRPSVIYTAICVLAGMAFSLIILSVTSSIKIRQPLQPTRLDLDALGLDPALKPGEDPVENDYWCGTKKRYSLTYPPSNPPSNPRLKSPKTPSTFPWLTNVRVRLNSAGVMSCLVLSCFALPCLALPCLVLPSLPQGRKRQRYRVEISSREIRSEIRNEI